jgi:hypothetical protein
MPFNPGPDPTLQLIEGYYANAKQQLAYSQIQTFRLQYQPPAGYPKLSAGEMFSMHTTMYVPPLMRDQQTLSAPLTPAQLLDGLQLGLDAVGVVDPTGIADGTNAGIYAARGQYAAAGISVAGIVGLDALKAARFAKYQVGAYNVLKRGAESGLDAHHVGQKALMAKFIPGYNFQTAPSILLPKAGHTISADGAGVLSRSMTGFDSARQVIARDIRELRRVYPDIPNSRLQELVKMNKQLYRQVR